MVEQNENIDNIGFLQSILSFFESGGKPGSKEAFELFGKLYRKRRLDMDLTLEETAEAAGIEVDTLKVIESGNFRVSDNP